MINNVILEGRLTDQPTLKYTKDGKAVATFTLAVNRNFKNPQGKYDADFIPCVAWGKLGELAANHLDKGSLISVEGRLQIRSYEAQDGTKRKAAEIVLSALHFLSKTKKAGDQAEGHSHGDTMDELEAMAMEDNVPF